MADEKEHHPAELLQVNASWTIRALAGMTVKQCPPRHDSEAVPPTA